MSKENFREKIKGALLNVLKTEDIYIDNDKIIPKLNKYQLTVFLSIYLSSTYH